MTDRPPLVSIVTPVLNRVSSIGLSLASVAAQTYDNVEHIVIDGGSTDGTIDTIRAFADDGHRIRLLSEQDNGMYDAVNKGLALAEGDVLAYLNSDDVYLPWSVELAVRTLASGADFAFGDLGVFRCRDRMTFMLEFYAPFDLNHYTYFRNLGQPTVFWQRSAYEALGGFDDSYRLLGDCEYWLRAGTSGFRFIHIPDVTAIQFDHPQTLRMTHRQELREEFERLRATHRLAAGPPDRLGHVRAAVGWRLRMVRFYVDLVRRDPAGWRHFITWFRQNEMPSQLGVLRCLLPASTWPRSMSMTDANRLVRALERSIQADPSS